MIEHRLGVAGGQRDWVLLNAGLLLYAGGRGASLAECTSLARRALEDGAGARKLEALTQAPLPVSQGFQAALGSVV